MNLFEVTKTKEVRLNRLLMHILDLKFQNRKFPFWDIYLSEKMCLSLKLSKHKQFQLYL